MTVMIFGLALFLGVHLLPSFVSMRERLVEKMGVLPYRGLFSVLSLIGFYFIVVGKAQAPFIEVWSPPTFTRHATMLLVLLAFIALPAAYIPSNLKRILKHPMLVAVKLWALGHLLANGDLASLLLFGSFLAFAVYDRISVKRRGQTPDLPAKPIYMDVLVIIVGVAVYGLVAMNHASLFGVPVFVR